MNKKVFENSEILQNLGITFESHYNGSFISIVFKNHFILTIIYNDMVHHNQAPETFFVISLSRGTFLRNDKYLLLGEFTKYSYIFVCGYKNMTTEMVTG